MIGAILGDIIGSPYEFNPIKTKDFPLFTENCRCTDDSYMTMAVAKALVECNGNYADLSQKAISAMQEIGRSQPHAGWGLRFMIWLARDNPKPYKSFGNGCGMRISPVGFVAQSIDEVKDLSRKVTEISHNHPKGIKGAEAVAMCVYLARIGHTKEQIRDYVTRHYYKLNFTCDEIRPTYSHSERADESIPQAIECFLESESLEDAIRLCVSIGGDCDTTGAIAGAIAEAYYGLPHGALETARSFCPPEYFTYIEQLEAQYGVHRETTEKQKPIVRITV